MGGAGLLHGLCTLQSESSRREPFVEFEDYTRYTANSFGSDSTSRPLRAPRPATLGLQISLSAAVIAVAVMLILRRFTLRFLTCTVLLVGALGALPSLFLPDRVPGTFAFFKLRLAGDLEDARIVELRRNLEPQRVLETLPEGFMEELQLAPGRVIQSVELTTLPRFPGTTELLCKVHFEDGLENRQRQALASLTNAWFSHQVLAEAAEQGMTFSKGVSVNPASFGGIWPKWKAEWEEGLRPTAQDQP
jgi:hypothetical protein